MLWRRGDRAPRHVLTRPSFGLTPGALAHESTAALYPLSHGAGFCSPDHGSLVMGHTWEGLG